MTENDNDGLSDLMGRLALKQSGWHRIENAENGAVGFFPVTATDVDAWEQRAIAQAMESERTERQNRPAPKPVVNEYSQRKRVVRGD